MSRHKWAGIVYGRSYNLDFRFIAVPEDFTHQEISWASEYILATTRNARKLTSHPRWSLFKNNSHCVVGVTCMVRDLIGKLGEDLVEILSKDNRGRPLYVFVGYVTKLERQKYLLDLPDYTGDHLENFKSLYRYVEQVWSVKDYDKDSKKPLVTNYQKQAFFSQQLHSAFTADLIEQLNHPEKSPDRVFLWQNSPEQNCKLWATSANLPKPVSICLNLNYHRHFNTPFLNQTVSELEDFTILNRTDSTSDLAESNSNSSSTFPQVIVNKVKEDIELTLQHATQVATAGQELIDNLTKPLGSSGKDTYETSTNPSNQSQEINQKLDTKELTEAENFGFKAKSSSQSARESQNWF
jgi:hypothetical protein